MHSHYGATNLVNKNENVPIVAPNVQQTSSTIKVNILLPGATNMISTKKKVLIIPGKIGIEPFDSVQAGSSRSENGKSHSTLVEAVSKFKYPRQNKTMQIA
mmetsp:Transcript_48505/g.96551  ORF Transcript_48505/g.96551 Transcript_48505/m.96551 type:complete len:101 (+) Transcript_48505:141-443(+)